MTSETVTSEAYRVRAIAEAGPIGKRHSSFELYDLLAKCMRLAERCRASKPDFDQIQLLVTQQPHGGNRRYVERGSDEYTMICRFVFSNLRSTGAERSNASRYAHTLRQASRCGLNSSTIAEHLTKNGGINALFLRRPLERFDVLTKCLVLTEQIRAPKGGQFTVKLRRTSDNRYDVLEFSHEGKT